MFKSLRKNFAMSLFAFPLTFLMGIFFHVPEAAMWAGAFVMWATGLLLLVLDDYVLNTVEDAYPLYTPDELEEMDGLVDARLEYMKNLFARKVQPD